jgi:MtN3 and saliva related transmembrane protein
MLISYLAIPLMMLSSVPQIFKLIKTKDSKGISLSMFYLTFVSVFLLFIEALRIGNEILIIADVSSLSMLLVNIILIKKYESTNK